MSLLTPQNFGVTDFETTRIELTDNQEFLLGGVYDYNNKDNVYLSNSIPNIINYFIQSDKDFFYFHNLGYDFRFMYDYLMDNYNVDIIPYSSNVLKVVVSEGTNKLFELRDSYPLLRTSLKDANKTFNKHYFKEDIGDEILNFNKNNPVHIDYLKKDCLSLYESLSNMRKIYGFEKMFLTIAGCAFMEIKKHYPNHDKLLQLPSNFDSFFRAGYYGGRTETFYQKGEKLKGYDFNSLYPAVMERYKYPIGAIYRTHKDYSIDDLMKNHEFFYCKVKNIKIPDMFIPPLPVRHNKSLLFPVGKIKEGVYNSVDIRLLFEMGGSCDLIYGYYWKKSDFIFKKFVNKYYPIKVKAKKNKDLGEYERAKRMLNTGYGKYAQKNELESFIKIDNREDLFIYEKKGYDVKPCNFSKKYKIYLISKLGHKNYTTTQISSFICSYARRDLYYVLIEAHNAGFTVNYCDTDSSYTDYLYKNCDK